MHYEGGHVALLSISDQFCLAPLYPLLVDNLKNATLIDIDLVFAVVDKASLEPEVEQTEKTNETKASGTQDPILNNKVELEGETCAQVSRFFQKKKG